MQNTNDLDKAGLKGTIEEHMHRLGDSGFATLFAAVANVEATNAWKNISMIRSQRTLRIICYTAHCGREESAIANASP